MKKLLLIAAGATTGLIVYYLIKKKYAGEQNDPQQKELPSHGEHHLTYAFSNAKKHAVG